MTKERAKVLLAWVPYIQAVEQGKTIQTRDHDQAAWRDITDFSFVVNNCYDEDAPTNKPTLWRIKPEPREFWIVRWSSGSITTCVNLDSAQSVGVSNVDEIIHVREVLPE